jgi:hypothetical protein
LFIIVIVMTAAIARVKFINPWKPNNPLVAHIGADIAIEVDAGALMA